MQYVRPDTSSQVQSLCLREHLDIFGSSMRSHVIQYLILCNCCYRSQKWLILMLQFSDCVACGKNLLRQHPVHSLFDAHVDIAHSINVRSKSVCNMKDCINA
jgi:hypothetical protein